MTKRLEAIVERLRLLPEHQQNAIAEVLEDEVEAASLDLDDPWVQTSLKHADALDRMSKQVLADDAAGLCEILDPDKL